MNEYYIEEDILFVDEALFGDSNEHSYDVVCYDGYGIAKKNGDAGYPMELMLAYPTLAEVLADEEKSSYVLRYRGLWDLKPSDITYGDIMIAYGDIVS